MKRFLKYFFTLGIAALSFAACEEEQLEPVNFTISADSAFNSALEATVTVTGDKAAPSDIEVAIFLDNTSTFPAGSLDFAASVKVAAGSKEATTKVKISGIDALEGGKEYKAVFGAKVNDVPLQKKVTISFTKPEDPVTFRFSADPEFVNNITVLKVDATKEVKEETLVTITLDAKSTMPAEALTIPEFKIAKGAKYAEIQVTLNPDVLTPGQEYTAIFNAAIGGDAIGSGTTGFNNPVKVLTLADLVALMPAENKEKADFKGIINDLIVTYVSGSNIFLEDATSAILLYKSGTGLQAGVTLSGYFEGKVQNYNGLPEISDLTFNQEDVTIGQGEVPAPAEMTIADILANFDKLISRRVKLTNVYAGGDIQQKGEYTIYQGEATMPFYTNVDLQNGFKKGSIFDVTAIVTPYNDKKQVKIFEEAAIGRIIPHMSMSDIQALCTSSSNANFAGVFDGLYVNYILGTQHIYLEDASGALRYYKESGNTLKVGDKVSGVITGTCRLDSGRPTINWLDMTYAKVEAAPADEQPKPVTGTLASFTDVAGLMYRRVTLENVVLDADLVTDKSSQIITISDATGTFSLHVRFKPSKKYVAGSTLSGTGTFDVASGNLEIRIFAEKEVTITAPEQKPALEKLWGVYSSADNGLWTNNVQSVSITHPDGYGMARTLTMDDEYIYLPKSSAYANIAAVSISNPQTQSKATVTGISGGSIFVTSCARMIKNTDASVNDGKDILLVSNLTATNSDAEKLVVYAYTNGISAAPVVLCAFCWDSANNVNDWRRYGDRFFVTGTWQEGKLYFPSFDANKTVVLSVANGARTAVTQIAAGESSPSGIKDLTVYPGSDNLFLTNASIANLVAPTGSTTAQGWNEFTLSGSSANGLGTWGYNFFTFEGKNYIAYARISGKKAWIEVIVDKGEILTSLEAQEGLMKVPLHSADNLDAEFETGGVADCCVRIIGGVPYIAGLTRDGGAAVCKMVLK